MQKGFIGFQVLEVATASQQQVLLHRSLQIAVGGLDIPVLIRVAHMDRACLQTVMGHQLQVFFVEPALFQAFVARLWPQLMRGSGRVIRLVYLRHSSQLDQRALQPQPDSQ